MKQKIFKKSIGLIMSALVCVTSVSCVIVSGNNDVKAMGKNQKSAVNFSMHSEDYRDHIPQLAAGRLIIECFPINNDLAEGFSNQYALANYVYYHVLGKPENTFNTQFRLDDNDIRRINECTEINLDNNNCKAGCHYITGIQNFKNLKTLTINNVGLCRLPGNLPETLTSLDASNNSLTTIPQLPDNITHLFLNKNGLRNLHHLPNALTTLKASGNQIAQIDNFSDNLEIIELNNNKLVNIPSLPNNVMDLSLNHNNLINIPNFPNKVCTIDLTYNHLNELPHLPDSAEFIYLTGNDNLVTLPNFPSNLITFTLQNRKFNLQAKDLI